MLNIDTMRRSHCNLHDIVDNLRFGSEKYFQLYIEKKGNINLSDGFGRTLMMWSVLDGKTNRVQALIDAGCLLNLGDKHNDTALMHAVQSANKEIAQILVLHGASVNCSNEDNCTPLMIAVQQDDLELVQFLLLHGANSNHICGHRYLHNIRSSLTHAIEGDQRDIIYAILKARQTIISLHLSVCIESHNIRTVEFLLAHGANVFYSGIEGSYGERILNEYLNGHLQSVKCLVRIFKENGFCTSVSKKNDILNCVFHARNHFNHSEEKEKKIQTILSYLLSLGMIPEATTASKLSLDDSKSTCNRTFPVPSLQKLSRTTIREALCFGISLKTDKLPIPFQLKNFILLNEECFQG